MARQSNVTAIDRGIPGQTAGLPVLPTKVFTVATAQTMTIGNFAFQTLDSNDFVQSVKGTSIKTAGIVNASNTQSWVNGIFNTPSDYNFSLVAGQRVEVWPKGNILVNVTEIFTGTGSIPMAQFMPVYARNSDGAIALGYTGTVAGYTLTNFVVTDPSTMITLNALVRVSNLENVDGAI